MDRPFLAHARDLAARGELAGLDVFGAVSEALGDLDLKTVRVGAANLAVHPIAPAALELDFQSTYIGAIGAHCPNATLVLDRFHIVKALNTAVDDVRKEQWRLASGNDRKALKGLRWLLYRHSSTRSRKDSRTLKALERGNQRIYRAWRLKDEFERFWEYHAPWAAERFIKRWMTSALRSRLDPLRKFVNTLRNHYAGVLAFIGSRLTNAISEGLNRVIKIVKNRASGFRNLGAFTDMIYLTVGDVDIPAQIPAKFHTLK